jgi:ribose/xylose/arabinose/galactoside ABC-type transport system permease subunit
LVLAIVVAALLRYSVLGRHLFAIGSSEATARLCGIPLARTKIAVYVLSGLFVGIAGIYQFARLRSGNPTSGLGLELKIIAAVVIGGGSSVAGHHPGRDHRGRRDR